MTSDIQAGSIENLFLNAQIGEYRQEYRNDVDLGGVLQGLEDIKRKLDNQSQGDKQSAELKDLLEQSKTLLGQLDLKKLEKKKAFKPKSRLRQCISLEETTEELLKKGEYDQAYGILVSSQEMSENGRDLWFLFQFWGNLMVAGRHEEAKEVHEKIIVTVRDELKSDHDEVFDIAQELQKSSKYFDAALMCLIANDLITGPVTLVSAADKHNCTSMLGNLTEELIKNKDLVPFIHDVLVPRGREMLCDILSTPALGGGTAIKHSHVKTRSLHAFEALLLNANCHKPHIEMGRIALNFMDGHYGENAKKQKFYGIISHNIGSSHMHLSQTTEAAVMFRQALDCFKVALDFDNEAERADCKKKSDEMIRIHCLDLLL